MTDEVALRRYQEYVESGQADADGHPSYMEFLGKPNLASAANKRLTQALGQQSFKSIDEANAFLVKHAAKENNSPREDFCGLSSQQLFRMHRADSLAELADFVNLNPSPLPPEARAARLPALVSWLLEQHRTEPKGLGLTSTGNYKTDLVRAIDFHFFSTEALQYPAKTENDLPVLQIAHDFLVEAGYTEENTTRSRLTPKGLSLAASSSGDRIWRELFSYLLYAWEWTDAMRYNFAGPHLELIQDSALLCLRLLARLATDFITNDQLYDAFVNAFPDFDPHWRTAEKTLYALNYDFFYLFVKVFCFNLGLIEYQPSASSSLEPPFRASPLLAAAIQWAKEGA
ncbi:MAG: hypothetical protein A2087_06140 [Spirochaetes bacterium GWD1_61_31]|nr:MAG: hypothetical protein A2087_06140 [Spirochaetes bacterium GWD1_61_31]OHD44699.1 MAG: hypothetical protein A2Y35_01115 [Spirochaetes bacterium GWE1_60_18]